MAHIALEDFIVTHREELIRRCQAKVESRVPPSPVFLSHHGVPLFLSQLCVQLRDGGSDSDDIGPSARKHGHDLLLQGFSIEQVVHDYGDVCQSITDLAVESAAPITTDDFRTLNRCLDDAIAAAVTEFTLKKVATRDKEFVELRNLANAAIAGFQAIRTGGVGVKGSTGDVVERNMLAIQAALAATGRSPEPKQGGRTVKV